MDDRNIKAAIVATKNEDPAAVQAAIENELNLRIVDALDDKKITVAQSMFDTPESEEYEESQEIDDDEEE